MAFCGVCKTECCESSEVKCTGKCGNVFHLHCVKSDSEGKITRSSKDWKCSTCKNKPSSQNSTRSGSSTSEVLTKNFLINVMENFKKEIFNEITTFRSEMNELTTSMQFLSDKVDASNTLMKEIGTKFAEMQKENQQLKAKNEELSRDVSELRERMRSLEQYSRIKNVEINGLPSTKDENVRELVKDVGAALGVQVQETDIGAAHRVPSFRRDREPALIVQFNTRAVKEEWITRYRQKKHITANQVNRHFPSQRVYVNDHLSPENKQFLAKLKQKGRELNYAFTWCRDGKFFAKRAEGQPVIKISSYDDLEKLK